MKFLLDAATSFTSITGVLLSIVIMICFYIYINRRIYKIESKIDGVLSKTLQMVQEVVDESKHVQCYTQPEHSQTFNTDQETNRECDDVQYNNHEEEVEHGEYDDDDDDEDYEDDDDDETDESDINENEIMDTDGHIHDTNHPEEIEQMTTDDVIPIFDIKSIHMDTDNTNEQSEKELKKQTVSDLRKKIVDMNLKTHEEAKKMKKGDIIQLLESL